MRCLRCQGTMIKEWIFTEVEGGTSMVRCLNCGDIIDDVVIFNRLYALGRFSERQSRKVRPVVSHL